MAPNSAAGQETMILCTAYGLLIYECSITKIEPKTEEEERKSSKKGKSRKDQDDDQP